MVSTTYYTNFKLTHISLYLAHLQESNNNNIIIKELK